MNRWIVYLIVLILCGCFGCTPSKNNYQLSKEELIVNEILAKTARRLKKETGLQPCGDGAQMMYKVKKLNLSFDYQGPIEIDKARELLLTAVDALVSAVNADQRIHPYLHNYPFEPKNVDIRIIVTGHDHLDVAPGELSVASAIQGEFRYKIDNPTTNLFTIIHQETYAEAKQKVNDLSQVVPQG